MNLSGPWLPGPPTGHEAALKRGEGRHQPGRCRLQITRGRPHGALPGCRRAGITIPLLLDVSAGRAERLSAALRPPPAAASAVRNGACQSLPFPCGCHTATSAARGHPWSRRHRHRRGPHEHTAQLDGEEPGPSVRDNGGSSGWCGARPRLPQPQRGSGVRPFRLAGILARMALLKQYE